MLIDLIVGSAVLLFGSFLFFWLRSPTLRARIERPKHVFLQQAQAHDAGRKRLGTDKLEDAQPHE